MAVTSIFGVCVSQLWRLVFGWRWMWQYMVVEIREWKSTNFSIPVPVVYKLHLNILVSILSKKKKKFWLGLRLNSVLKWIIKKCADWKPKIEICILMILSLININTKSTPIYSTKYYSFSKKGYLDLAGGKY